MVDYDRIVDDIRTVLMSDVDPQEDALKELDERYADAVNDVNDRLKKCDVLLNKGLRSEAIQESEVEPNLLEVVSILDFPEAQMWGDYVLQFGIPVPPPLLNEVAEQLNDAYNEEASLGDLLRRHRLHALLRSPLPVRINVLRSIAQRDSGNPIWQEDLRSYEQVRHNQLQEETELAVADNDLRKLSQLEQEVRSKAWLLPPQKETVAKITQAHTALRVKHARARLDQLVDELTEAHSGLEVGRARELRSLWNAQAAIAIDRDDDPILELVAPALEWLEDEDRREQEENDYQETIAQLNQALDDWASRQELERLVYQLRNFDREFPDTLNSRLVERFEAMELAARRKSRIIALGSVLAVLLIGSVTAWAIYAYTQSQVLKRHVANAQQLLGAGDLAGAQAYLDKLEQEAPAVFASGEIQTLVQQLQAAGNREQARSDQLAQLLAAAREEGDTWEGYGAAKELIDKAEPLAIGDREKAMVEEARRFVENRRRDLQQGYDKAFVAELNGYRQRCQDVDTNSLEMLSLLMEEGEQLQTRDRVSGVLLQQVPPLIARLKAQYQAEVASRSERDLLAAIGEAIGDRAKYQRALEAYVAGVPEAPRTGAFNKVLQQEVTFWEGVERWSSFSAAWSRRNYTTADVERASEYLAEAQAIIQVYPWHPAAHSLRTVVAFLEAIANRVGDGGVRIHLSLNEPLTMPTIADVKAAVVWDGTEYRRYYFNAERPPRPRAGQLYVYCYVDSGLVDTRSAHFDARSLANPVIAGDTFDWDSPQGKFSTKALNHLSKLNDHNWEESFYGIIKALDDQTYMEPVLKVQLFRLFLQVGCTGSYPMQAAYESQLQLLDTTPLNETANWIDPDDAEGKKARRDATALLQRLGFKTAESRERNDDPSSPYQTTRRVVELRAGMNQPVIGPRHVWVGWLHKDKNIERKWTITAKSDLELGSANLAVVCLGSDDSPTFKKVGRMTDNRAELQGAPPEALLEGRPVYAIVEDAEMNEE